MNKKRYLILIALIIFVFLAVFTFANPLNKAEDENRVLEEIEEEDVIEKEEIKKDEEKEIIEIKPVIVPAYNNHGVTINKVEKEEIKEDDNSYELALNAVEKVELTLSAEDLLNASNLIEKITLNDKKEELQERLDVVKEVIDFTDVVNTLVEEVKNAESKEDMDSAREYAVSKDVEKRLKNLSNEVVKKLLTEKLETIAELLDDTKAPTINIEDGAIFGEDTKITVTDDSEVTIVLNDEEIENNKVVSNGSYTLTATDASFNSATITFSVRTVGTALTINDVTTEYVTLTQALETLKVEDAEKATITIYGEQEMNVVRGFGIGGSNTKEVKFVGGNSKAKITNVGNGYTNISATNPNAVISYEGLIIADTTRYTENGSYAEWEFTYSDYAGNFNFTDCVFERSPLFDSLGETQVTINLKNCTFKQYDDEAKDSRYSVWVYSGANATIKDCTFEGTRGIKVHKNYEKTALAGKIVIDGNTFNSLSKKPGVVVGTITNLATTIEITNNTFIGNVPGDQGLYTYESDTVAPTIYENNTLNGVAHTLDTTVFNTWLNKQVQVTALVDGVSTKYSTLTEALTEINTKNVEEAKVTVYGNHELKPEALTLGGTNLKTLTFEKGNDTSKITIIGNGTTKTRTENKDAVVTFNGVSIDDISTPYTTHWNFYYTEFKGNFNFNNVKFYHQPLTEIGNFNFTNCVFENADSSRYAIWLYGGNVNVSGCNFTGTRGLKLHSNYGTGESYWGQLGKVVIDNNTFNALTEKPGVVVGHVNSLDPNGETIIEITNNTFINTTKPGDQGNYVYESDTVGPNVWSNNTLNGAIYTLDTSVYN